MKDIELSDDELERRMRRKLFLDGPSSRRSSSGLSAEEQRIAEKLMGRDNAERLARRRDNRRPYRPAPVVVTYEYYALRGDNPGDPTLWRINRIENGRAEQHGLFNSERGCIAEVAALRRKNFTVKEVVFGDRGRRRVAEPRRSGRQFILDKLKDFKP